MWYGGVSDTGVNVVGVNSDSQDCLYQKSLSMPELQIDMCIIKEN